MNKFIILLIVNTCIVVAYFIWRRMKKDEKLLRYLSKSIVMFLCPLAGPIFIFLGYIIYLRFFKGEVDLEDVVFAKDRVTTYAYADEERGRTMVSVEEALAVTDKDNLRTLMLNVVRVDIKDSLASISLALNSEDSETSHYAASVLQDALNNFRATVQKCYNEIQRENEDQLEHVLILIDYMDQVLKQNVFTKMEQESSVARFDEICEILYTKDGSRMTSYHFEAISLRLLEIKEFEKCKKWCERAVEKYPHTLSTYTCQLKLYFSNGDSDSFFLILEELKNSNIVIDNETLELIRVFNRK